MELFDATCVRNGDFMEYTARILNKGALDVSDIRLEANTGYNEVVQETWTGSLMPGQILNYSFVSSTKLFTQDEFCCVRINPLMTACWLAPLTMKSVYRSAVKYGSQMPIRSRLRVFFRLIIHFRLPEKLRPVSVIWPENQ